MRHPHPSDFRQLHQHPEPAHTAVVRRGNSGDRRNRGRRTVCIVGHPRAARWGRAQAGESMPLLPDPEPRRDLRWPRPETTFTHVELLEKISIVYARACHRKPVTILPEPIVQRMVASMIARQDREIARKTASHDRKPGAREHRRPARTAASLWARGSMTRAGSGPMLCRRQLSVCSTKPQPAKPRTRFRR